jgi:thiol-disulfide isomerase/thioredoxin
LDIRVDVDELKDDTLYLGYYYGNKKYFYDTLSRENGEFSLKADTLAPKGMYILLNKELKKYHDLVLEEDQVFSIETDSSFSVEKVSFEGSEINSDFYEYIRMISELKPKASELQQKLPDPSAQKTLDKLNKKVKDAQLALIDKYPESILAATIKSSMEMDIPEFEGSEKEVQMKKYRYFKTNYLDQVDISKEKLIRAPFFYPYVNRYIKKVVPQHPDSIINALDEVLRPMLKAESEAFKFFLVHYLNHFARSKIVGMDAVYVHLVNEYYKSGKAWWTDEKQLEKILDEVKKIEPTLIGKKAPPITVKKLDNEAPLSLYEIESPYTVLLFWDPECGHCKKAMPDFIEFYENYRDKGVKMVAVCTKLNQDAKEKCLEYIAERENMEIFTNVYDPFLRSRYKQKYDIRTTPRVYILDDEKEIIMKGIPAEKMSEVMDQIISVDQNKAAQKLK